MITTQEEQQREKHKVFLSLIEKMGGSVELKRPIRFRLTPHSPTVKIYKISITDDFNSYGEAQDAIIQTLKLLTNKTKNNESNQAKTVN